MLLIDTSVWISIFRDRTGQGRQKLEILINGRDVFLTRFILNPVIIKQVKTRR